MLFICTDKVSRVKAWMSDILEGLFQSDDKESKFEPRIMDIKKENLLDPWHNLRQKKHSKVRQNVFPGTYKKG